MSEMRTTSPFDLQREFVDSFQTVYDLVVSSKNRVLTGKSLGDSGFILK